MSKIKMSRAELKQAILDGRVTNVPPEIMQQLGLDVKPRKVSPKALFDSLNLDDSSGKVEPNVIAEKTPVDDEPWRKYYKPIVKEIKLRPAPVINKAYKKKINSFLTEVKKIEDPELNAQAMDILNSGANWADIGKAIAVLKYNDKQKRRAWALWKKEKESKDRLANSISLTKDRSKIKQKLAALAGTFETSANAIDYLTDNYDSSYVGWIDQRLHNIAKPINAADKKMEVFNQMYAAILPDFKELKNMGANFTESEQRMLKAQMPQLDSGDNLFLPNLLGFTVRLRNEIKNKLDAIEGADYKTGRLKKVVDRYDEIINKLKSKVPSDVAKTFEIAGGGVENIDKSNAPEGFISSIGKAKESNTTQSNIQNSKASRVVIKPGDTAALDAILGEL